MIFHLYYLALGDTSGPKAMIRFVNLALVEQVVFLHQLLC